MEISGDATIQTLIKSFFQFKKLAWHHIPIDGLKHSELFVLIRIKESNRLDDSGIMISEISRNLKVAPPTVTQLVNGLVTNRFVERSTDKEDRRAVRIKLTEKGESAVKKAQDALTDTFGGLVEFLGEDKSSELSDLLGQVFTYFKRLEEFKN
jgi:DNA-binding MarR family transcriptional regulator